MKDDKTSAGPAEYMKVISERLAIIERKTDQNAKLLRILQEVVVHGASDAMPWQRLKPARMRQVQSVLDFLRQHPAASIRHASARAFVKAEGGYRDAENLAAYCYDHKIKMYI